MGDQWYYIQKGQRKGPMAEEQLKQLAAAGKLKPTDKVWKKELASWQEASTLPWWPSAPSSPGDSASTPQANTPRPSPSPAATPSPASRSPSVQGGAAATRIVQCPQCATRLQVLATATRCQCPKCRTAITFPPVAGQPAMPPLEAAAQPQLRFFSYCYQHFAATHWPAIFGIFCGLLAIPVVSFFKPLLGFRGLCFVLAGSLTLSAVSGVIYFIQRVMAYALGGERAVATNAKSWMARLAYGGWTFLIPMAPWVGAEYFAPAQGLLATAAPNLRKELAPWIRLPPFEAGQPEPSAPAPAPASPKSSATAVASKQSNASTDEKATQTVIGKGAGVTEEEALKDACRDAVRQAVGTLVDAETAVTNDDVINDRVLAGSDGFITKHDVLSSKKEGGLLRTTIRASVDRRKLLQKLQAANIAVR